MRAFSMEGNDLQLGLADVDAKFTPVVEELGFTRVGALFVRRFPADAEYWEKASARFEFTAEEMVAQAGGVVPVRWESTLELLHERAVGIEWRLEGDAAELGYISIAGDARKLAAALADLLVEPFASGRFRAFGQARIECRSA
ncbi:MAG TPA: hypothetical protein VFM96_04125 [Gaiellaceae bacterium]|nr:hypothetical protein [Gaiellaceae bacterium]